MFAPYREAARRLSLAFSPASLDVGTPIIEMGGLVHGAPVRVRRLVGTATREVMALLHPSLDLGLSVTPASPAPPAGARDLRWVGRLFGPADLHTRDAELEGAFAVHGDEPARARTLVEALREPLRALHRAGARFVLDDAGLRIERSVPSVLEESPDEIEGDVRAAAAVVARVASARASLPLAAPLEPHASSFAELADWLGAPRPEGSLLVRGTLRGHPVDLGTARVSVLRYVFVMTFGWSLPPSLEGIRTPAAAPAMLAERAPVLTERGVHWAIPVEHEPLDWVGVIDEAHGFVAAIEGSFTRRPPYR